MIDITYMPGVTLYEIEKAYIIKAFRFYQGNKTMTARSLGIAIRTLDNKLLQYDGKVQIDDVSEIQPKGTESTVRESSNSRLDVEPHSDSSRQEQSMSLRKREEIQKMSSGASTQGSTNHRHPQKDDRRTK